MRIKEDQHHPITGRFEGNHLPENEVEFIPEPQIDPIDLIFDVGSHVLGAYLGQQVSQNLRTCQKNGGEK